MIMLSHLKEQPVLLPDTLLREQIIHGHQTLVPLF